MRNTVFVIVLTLAMAACGENAPDAGTDPGTTSSVTSTAPIVSSTTQVLPSSSTTTAPMETAAAEFEFSVLSHASDLIGSLPGSRGALGSGCTPAGTELPDGVWFGWIVETASTDISFDLACARSGGDALAISNDSRRLRTVSVAAAATAYPHTEDGSKLSIPFVQWRGTEPDTACAERADFGLGEGCPWWLYVNGGAVTEMVQVLPPALWTTTPVPAWISTPCCDSNASVPPSPPGPLPDEGLPPDGFYSASVDRSPDRPDELVVDIGRWVPCVELPEFCIPGFGEIDVGSDPSAGITRRLALDDGLTVMIQTIPSLSDPAPGITASGSNFAALLHAIDSAWDTWVIAPFEQGTPPDEISAVLADQGSLDDTFPFGVSDGYGPGEGPVGFRGPAGSYLFTEPYLLEYDAPWGYNGLYRWWTVLEIRDGRPILYVDTGSIAG